IAARLDVLEVILHLTKWKILIDVLPHLVSGLNVERHPGNHPESAEPNHGSLKLRGIRFAAEFHYLSGSGYQLQSGHRARQVAVFLARSMCCGAASACDL